MGKTYICTDWVPQNDITTPIVAEPDYYNSGIIKAVTKDQEKIQVGRITYELFPNEEFQYTITPFWEIIDTLTPDVFQGIPGIDMELRLEHYYRVNYVPVFITERTPGPNREDLWELLESVGLDYYDRLEWLIRTDLQAAVDNLIVERARDDVRTINVSKREELEVVLMDSQYGDKIIIDNFQVLGRNSRECMKQLNRLMHYGVRLISQKEQMDLQIEDYKSFMPLVAAMYQMDRKNRCDTQKEGIARAKAEGIYKGRKRKPVDEELFKDVLQQFEDKRMSIQEALGMMNMSKSTFYRRIREYKKEDNSM